MTTNVWVEQVRKNAKLKSSNKYFNRKNVEDYNIISLKIILEVVHFEQI